MIFLSSLDDTKDKVRGLEVGAVDFVSKPFQKRRSRRAGQHATQSAAPSPSTRGQERLELARELAVAQELLTDARRRVEGPLLGDSPAIRAVRESIARYAADADALMLTGTQGRGHEAVARAIHHGSARSRQAFIHVNCALLPPGRDPGSCGRLSRQPIQRPAPHEPSRPGHPGHVYSKKFTGSPAKSRRGWPKSSKHRGVPRARRNAGP